MQTVAQQIAVLRARMVARRDTFRAMRYLLAAGFPFESAARFVAAHSK